MYFFCAFTIVMLLANKKFTPQLCCSPKLVYFLSYVMIFLSVVFMLCIVGTGSGSLLPPVLHTVFSKSVLSATLMRAGYDSALWTL